MSTDIALRRYHPMPAAERQDGEISEVVLYWRSIVKRKWAILGIAIIVAVLAALAALSTTPVYHATATLLIEQNRTKLVATIEEVYGSVSNNREHFETQADLLGSRALAIKVIAKLNLTKHPELDPRQGTPPFWRLMLKRVGVGAENKPLSEKQIHSAVLNAFMSRVSIEPGR